jgi:hypothetical protein
MVEAVKGSRRSALVWVGELAKRECDPIIVALLINNGGASRILGSAFRNYN